MCYKSEKRIANREDLCYSRFTTTKNATKGRLFAMNTVTLTMKFRQAILNYAEKYGVTKAAIRYRVNWQYVYRWKRRYNGDIHSLADRSHRPKHHPNEHTPEELKLIADMRRRNPSAGLVIFWVKLMQKGYSRSITGLYLSVLILLVAEPANFSIFFEPFCLGRNDSTVKSPSYIATNFETIAFHFETIASGV